jgi:hypothetical protein
VVRRSRADALAEQRFLPGVEIAPRPLQVKSRGARFVHNATARPVAGAHIGAVRNGRMPKDAT